MIFCTSVECMDGRIQEPVARHLKNTAGATYVDTITEPGPCRILSDPRCRALRKSILDRVRISVESHGSELIAVSGHHDCAGNPVGEAAQREQVRRSVAYLRRKFPKVRIVGLWVDSGWAVHPVPGSDA